MKRKRVGDYKKRLKIDKHDLDRELIEQPGLFMEVAEKYAMAVSERDQAREDQKRIDADVWSEYAGTKDPKWKVEQKIEADERHIEARENYKAASLEADRWLAIKEAFQQRSFVLRELASLYVANYYDSTSVRGGDAQQVEESKNQDRRRTMNERRRDKKRRKQLG